MKNLYKYIAIAVINWISLRYLLKISTDKLDVQIDESYTLNGIVLITAVTLLSLAAIRIFLYFTRKRVLRQSTKITAGIAIMLTVSSFLYFQYLSKHKRDIIDNDSMRGRIAMKVKNSDWNSGTKAENLSLPEYLELKRKITKLPNLPTVATSINFYYEYESFLPDYIFSLEYSVPKNTKIENQDYEKDGLIKKRSSVYFKNVKRVTYSEVQT